MFEIQHLYLFCAMSYVDVASSLSNLSFQLPGNLEEENLGHTLLARGIESLVR